MRLHEVALLAALVPVALAGCSRLTFVKSDAQRRSVERVAPDYAFRDSSRGKQKVSARRLVSDAGQKLQAGDLRAAMADGRAALKADPRFAPAHTLVAVVATRQGEAALAGRHYARAAELSPTDAMALGAYGAWLCGESRAGESLGWFEKALAIPGDAALRGQLMSSAGACALKAGRADYAEQASRAALQLSPEDVVALGTLARQNFDHGRYFEARAFSQRRLAAAPANADALALASQIEQKLGDTVAATRYAERLTTEFPQARIAGPGEKTQP